MWNSDVERSIAQACGKHPSIVRFLAARLLVELTLSRQLTPDEAKVLWWRLPKGREAKG
jgi:hypothetical protein